MVKKCFFLQFFLLFAALNAQPLSQASKIGLQLPAILFLYNDSSLNTLSSLKEDGFSVEDASFTIKKQWGISNSQQLQEHMTELLLHGSHAEYLYIKSLVERYANTWQQGDASAINRLFVANDPQSLQLVEQLQRLYADLDAYSVRRLYFVLNMRHLFKLYPESLRGWDLARVVSLARWGYDLGLLQEEEAWSYIEMAGRYVLENFDSWNSYVENYIYGRLFEYARLDNAELLLRDSILLWHELLNNKQGWAELRLSLYEEIGQSSFLELFKDLYTFQQAIREGRFLAVDSLLKRQDTLNLALLAPADQAFYQPLDQPDAHRRSPLSLAVAHVEILNLLLSNGFRYDNGDAQGYKALYWAITEDNAYSVTTLLQQQRGQSDRQGQTPLHWAAQYAQTSVIQMLLKAGFSPLSSDNLGNTPLHLAALSNNVSSNTLFWEKAQQPLAPNNQGETLLHLALKNKKHPNIAALLLQKRRIFLKINAQDRQGLTSLMLAAKNQRNDMLLMLLEAGADTHLQDIHGSTALHYAAQQGQLSALRLLLQYSRDTLNTVNNSGMTPLMLASEYGDAQAVNLLLRSGADGFLSDHQGKRALHYAAASSLSVLETLLEYTNELNPQDKNGWTALYDAVAANNLETAQYLIDAGLQIESSSEVLRLAIRGNNYEMLRLLLDSSLPLELSEPLEQENLISLAMRFASYRIFWTLAEAGAALDEIDSQGNTSLHVASKYGSAEMLAYLLERNIDPSLKNNQGETALHLATEDRQAGAEKVRLLAEKNDLEALDGQNMTPLARAAKGGNVRVLRSLLNAGAQINNTESSWPALVAAASASSPEMMLLLLDREADVNAMSETNQRTALHYTVSSSTDVKWTTAQRLAMAKRLLAAGGIIDVTDSQGNTPLFWAALQGEEPLIRWLLDNGANPHLENNEGLTPFHFALQASYRNTYRILQHSGAEMLNHSDGQGLLPLERAARLGDTHTLQLLIATGAQVNSLGSSGLRPLFFALFAPSASNLAVLLRAGANPRLKGGENEDLLLYALQNGASNFHILQLLSSRQLSMRVDEQGNTALHLALEQERVSLIQPLLRAGNPLNAMNDNGDTPMHTAVKSGNLAAVRLLLEEGADPFIVNHQQLSAVALAQESNQLQITELFKESFASFS